MLTLLLALEEYYLHPRFAGDDLPTTATLGQCLAISEKVRRSQQVFFPLAKAPTGDKDPFGSTPLCNWIMLRIIIECRD